VVLPNNPGACEFSLAASAPAITQRPGGLLLTERALTRCQFARRARIVDIGCGSATTVQHLVAGYDFQAVGIDADAGRLYAAHSHYPETELACGLGNRLPLSDAWADGVMAECSISIMVDRGNGSNPDHRGDFQALFNEFRRILKPGGQLIASDLYTRLQPGTLALRHLVGECYLKHVRMQAELFDLLHQCGFEIRLWEDHSDQLKGFSLQWALTFCSRGGSKPRESPAHGLPDAFDLQLAVSKALLGYYLLIAEKR